MIAVRTRHGTTSDANQSPNRVTNLERDDNVSKAETSGNNNREWRSERQSAWRAIGLSPAWERDSGESRLDGRQFLYNTAGPAVSVWHECFFSNSSRDGNQSV